MIELIYYSLLREYFKDNSDKDEIIKLGISIINLIVLMIQAIVIYKFINAKKRNKDIKEELEDIYTMEEKWNI